MKLKKLYLFFPRVLFVAVCALAAAAFADYLTFSRREACTLRNGPLFSFAHILLVAALDAVVVDFHAVLYVS